MKARVGLVFFWLTGNESLKNGALINDVRKSNFVSTEQQARKWL